MFSYQQNISTIYPKWKAFLFDNNRIKPIPSRWLYFIVYFFIPRLWVIISLLHLEGKFKSLKLEPMDFFACCDKNPTKIFVRLDTKSFLEKEAQEFFPWAYLPLS